MSATILFYDEDEDHILITVEATGVVPEEEAPEPSETIPQPIADIIDTIETWSGGDATVTWGHLVLGDQHVMTGHYVVSYDESEIKMLIFPRAAVTLYLPVGLISRYDLIGFTDDFVDEGDYVIQMIDDEVYRRFVVKEVEPWFVADQFYFYFVGLELVPR